MCLKCYTVATGTIKAINFCNLLLKVKSLNELSKPSRCDQNEVKTYLKNLGGKHHNLQVAHTIEKERQVLFLHLLYKIEKTEKF